MLSLKKKIFHKYLKKPILQKSEPQKIIIPESEPQKIIIPESFKNEETDSTKSEKEIPIPNPDEKPESQKIIIPGTFKKEDNISQISEETDSSKPEPQKIIIPDVFNKEDNISQISEENVHDVTHVDSPKSEKETPNTDDKTLTMKQEVNVFMVNFEEEITKTEVDEQSEKELQKTIESPTTEKKTPGNPPKKFLA